MFHFTVSTFKSCGLFFKGWGFFSEQKQNVFKIWLKAGEVNSERTPKKERGQIAYILLERQCHLDLSPRVTFLCVVTLCVYNILKNVRDILCVHNILKNEKGFLPLYLEICTKKEENQSDISTFTFLIELLLTD